MDQYLNWNGRIIKETEVSISPENRSFKFGDGCFETMKILNGKLLLHQLHFERLFSSLTTLKFPLPSSITSQNLHTYVLELAAKNHLASARVRLTFYRGDGNLKTFATTPGYIIQTIPLDPPANELNKEGYITTVYQDAKKTVDQFSSLKSNNYLPYIMAAIKANEQQIDDCLLLNCYNRITEATTANIFIVDNGIVKTPPLSEGCINGVMRKYLMNCIKKDDLPFLETQISTDDLYNASEVFFTNALTGIRWVKKVDDSQYTNQTSSFLYQKFIQPLFNCPTF